MVAAARKFCFGLAMAAASFAAAGCVQRSGRPATLIGDYELPLGMTVGCPHLVAPVPPPGGFSSTYQRYLLERQRTGRQVSQEAQAQTPAPGDAGPLATPETSAG